MNRREIAHARTPLGWVRLELSAGRLAGLSFVRAPGGAPPAPTSRAIEWKARVSRYFKNQTGRPGPIRPEGTPFQRKVWSRLGRIRAGSVVSYQGLARSIGRPSSARAVANAVGANPIAIFIPCHRVVRTDGTIGGYASGVWRKRWLLRHESRQAAGKRS